MDDIIKDDLLAILNFLRNRKRDKNSGATIFELKKIVSKPENIDILIANHTLGRAIETHDKIFYQITDIGLKRLIDGYSLQKENPTTIINNSGTFVGLNSGHSSSIIDNRATPKKQNKATITQIIKWSLLLLGGGASIVAIIEYMNKGN